MGWHRLHGLSDDMYVPLVLSIYQWCYLSPDYLTTAQSPHEYSGLYYWLERMLVLDFCADNLSRDDFELRILRALFHELL